jgi:regulator of sirC expression with transglutaminase-like and TPR domain
MANFNTIQNIEKELILTKQKLQEEIEKNKTLTEKLIENERMTQNVIGYLLNEAEHGQILKRELTQTKSELSKLKSNLQKLKQNLDLLI